ncbi:MAG: ribosomal protein S18-alanine N-acetyltransferase [Chloroflexota bacterium]
MTLVVRRMIAPDVPAAAQIDAMSESLPWPERSFRAELETPYSRGWVAETGGRVVGLLVLWLIVDEAHIATIAVHPDVRRRGIGRLLLKTALEAAAAEGAKSGLLEVRAGNLAAQELYKGFGFVEVGRRPKYYKDNGEDAVLMNLAHLEKTEEP